MDPNIHTQIVRTLEAQILNGTLSPGAVLQQEDLAALFQVSRQPIRAVLEILAAKQLATRRPNRTFEVARLPEDTAREALAIRKVLEPMALAASIHRLSKRNLLRARQAQELFEIEDVPECLAEHDTAFHLALYSECQNALLLDQIASLRALSRRAYAAQPLGSNAREACIASHWDLLTTVEKQDADTAQAILMTHFDIAKDRAS